MITYVKLKHDILGVIWSSFLGIYTQVKHLRKWILHGDWLNDSHEVIASFSIFSLLKYDTNGLGTKGPHSPPFDKTLLGLCNVSNVSKGSNFLLKMG